MGIIEVLKHIIVSILLGYLAFTDMLAEQVINWFPSVDSVEDVLKVETSVIPDQPSGTGGVSFKPISSHYKIGGPLPRILIENTPYQDAAVGAALLQDTESEPNTSKPIIEFVTDAIVNIFCQYRTKEHIRTTTGTGFFIHKDGVVLTNAHVAQFLLLDTGNADIIESECVLRAGNPATPLYHAELLYLSPAWIHQNASQITKTTPRGTGERDFALLYVSKPVGKNPLPGRFPHIPLDFSSLPQGTQGLGVYAGGYPAHALIREGADAELAPKVAKTEIVELYTFGSNQADLLSLSSSPVGEQGASGGPVVNDERKAIGLIVTKGDEKAEGKHSLRALSLDYINRAILEETGFTLKEHLRGDLDYRSAVFKRALAPFLTRLLEFELE